MYSLHLKCTPGDLDRLSGELWEHGTAGIREVDDGDRIRLIAGFEDNADRGRMLEQFADYEPEWEHEDETDWVQHTRDAWPARVVGEKLFIAPLWSLEETPGARIRIVHNPGLACGTGEHPCTQLALAALEEHVFPGAQVVDIGTGSGLLAIAALGLGAVGAVGIDVDEAALRTARENFDSNNMPARLAVGSADCLRTRAADIVVANISATVLLTILDELVRIAKPRAMLILTGFPASELGRLRDELEAARVTTLGVTAMNEWRCLVATASSGLF